MASERDTLNRIRQKCENVLAPGAVQYSALEACIRQVVRDCEVAVAESATTTADAPEGATVDGIVRNIVGWADKAKSHTKDEYVLGCLGQIANWTKSLTVDVSKTEITTGNNARMREALGDVYDTLEKLQPYALQINDISLRRAFRNRLCHAKNVIDDALAAPPEPQGNMAKMREALVKIEKMAHCNLCNVYPKYRDLFNNKIGGIEREARAALAAPARNCDKSRDYILAALKREKNIDPLFTVRTVVDFMLAEATKGATDGDK